MEPPVSLQLHFCNLLSNNLVLHRINGIQGQRIIRLIHKLITVKATKGNAAVNKRLLYSIPNRNVTVPDLSTSRQGLCLVGIKEKYLVLAVKGAKPYLHAVGRGIIHDTVGARLPRADHITRKLGQKHTVSVGNDNSILHR